MLNLNLKGLVEELKSKKYMRVLLQAPEGLKTRAGEISEAIEKEVGIETIISGEPCYGACDLPIEEAKLMGCGAIIHLGHSDFGVKTDVPVIYLPLEYRPEIPKGLEEKLRGLPEKNVSLYSSVQFKPALDWLEETLKKQGKTVEEKKIILGCSEVKNDSELSIFIGSGKFHPLAISAGNGRVLRIDLEKGEISDLSEHIKREQMKKFARLEKLKDAKSVGILVSKKPGQFHKEFGELRKKLSQQGKRAEVLIFDEITDEKLLGLPYDAYINTACPRILDNSFKKPVINLRDLE
ncbi:MAG: diphthamide biosynthesis enzyme Dph2 [Candidatus Aenigmarchaeota archaeon]|nr:diphthamide biosynthesis enzyme Dph2 [Candidatus Aenigmarchaeota archaeon]